MRGLLLLALILSFAACTPVQVETDNAPKADLMRENLNSSLGARLADAELALNRFDNAGALKLADEVDAATKDWKKLTPREQVALGFLEQQSREIRFIALLFGAQEDAAKLKELFAADTDRLFERFAGDGSTMQSAACYQLYEISGRSDEATRGYMRMLALLEGRAHEVRRFRVTMLRASTLAGMNMVEAAAAELEAAAALLKALPQPKVEDLSAFGSFHMLPALIRARQNDYAGALELLGSRLKDVPEHVAKPRLERYVAAFKELAETWPVEESRYKAEKPDLPRVEIETDKGKMIIVLFEDDCPNTVASFITLVEKGFYDGTVFHRVVPHFVVQGGDPNGTGEGGPGYSIKREATRKHFRGSLGMARSADPDSAGSQFYFCLHAATTFHLNQGYCVFGRVSQGLEVMDALRLGSKILKARVINKRAHDYKVEKLPVKE